jgi:hypothetical protein
MQSLYRREPITGFMLTAGLVDALIGGMGGYRVLLAIGLGTAGLAIGIRWKLMQPTRREPMPPQTKSQSRRSRYLPDSDAHRVTIDVDARKVT